MFLVLLFSNFWIKLQLVVSFSPAVIWLIIFITMGKQEVTAHFCAVFIQQSLIQDKQIPREEAKPWADSEPIEPSLMFFCPLVEDLHFFSSWLPDWRKRTSPHIVLVLFWLLCVTLKVTNCKKIATTASSDSNICSVRCISWLRGIGELQHLFTQMPTGFWSFI